MYTADITRQFVSIVQDRVQAWPKLLQIVVGPRQVGKTTGVKQVFEAWNGPKHFASADTPLPPSGEWITQVWNRARAFNDNTLLVIDEIQKVERWSEVVKSLFDQDRASGRLRVVLLGSASLNLTRGLSDSLVGRYELINVPHWSCFECQLAFGWTFEQFLKFGGYPGAAPLISDPLRWRDYIVNSVIDPVINRDIPALQEIRKPALFRQVFELALHYPAQEISYQKLLGQLQESGNATTVKHYIEILSQAFLVKALEKYSTRALSSKASSPKIIPLCPALINAVKDPLQVERDKEWRGRVLEACIGAKLLQSRGQVYYWREGKHEVDFILKRDDLVFGFEVKSNTRKPIGGLNAFSSKFKRSICISIDLEIAKRILEAQEIDTFIDSEFLGK